MEVSNEVITISYLEDGIISYNIQYQASVAKNPSQAIWEILNEDDLLFLHSTSWRYIKDIGLIITWIASAKSQLNYENL